MVAAIIVNVGDKFNRWTIIGRSIKVSGNRRTCRVRCECGTEKYLHTTYVVSGTVKSCGCLRNEKAAERTSLLNLSHGMSDTWIHGRWSDMKRRCRDKSRPGAMSWAGRGITVCDRWDKSFSAFLSDMGFPPNRNYSLDRINNDGNYEPDNCRWASVETQAINRRSTVLLEYAEERLSLTQWSRIVGVSVSTLSKRIKAGWSVTEALTTPSAEKSRESL